VAREDRGAALLAIDEDEDVFDDEAGGLERRRSLEFGAPVGDEDDALARFVYAFDELFRPVGLGFLPGVAERMTARERRGHSKGNNILDTPEQLKRFLLPLHLSYTVGQHGSKQWRAIMAAEGKKQAVVNFVSHLLSAGLYQVVLSKDAAEIRIISVGSETNPPRVRVSPDGCRTYTPPIPWLPRSLEASRPSLHIPAPDLRLNAKIRAQTEGGGALGSGNKEIEGES
jgi:hypothetical protein